MTFILLLLLQFSAFAQKDSTTSKDIPIYSLTDEKTKGTPTIRLRPTQFLVYQSIASYSKANAQKEFSEAISRDRNQVTQANIIPIGILNADIETPDEKDKKKDFVLMASPIQKDIFQADIQFQISPKLLQTNLDNQIESIEISFDNGDNWKSYKYEEQLISYQFKRTGEQEIGFRIKSKKGTYITFATVDVKQLVRLASTEPKRVSAASSVKRGDASANVNGAEYRIVMGCDGIFDKPIIIAEGFDASENVNLDDLEAKYFEPLTLYRNNGYDLVLVNYDNGRTWIQDNAQVLKAVINQVNATKVGNNKLVVIGESMSGLVARYALKQMENDGQNPNVSHFVAFDTPMKGANVPAGLIGIRRWAPTAFGISVILLASFLNDVFDFCPIVSAIDQPAAKQMLLTQQGNTPAPEFFQFQTELNNLGYPSQYGIKNIALINGALDGSAQRRYIAQDVANGYNEIDQGEFNQGDKFLDYSIWGILNVRSWTHTINVNSEVGYANVPFRIFEPASRFYLNSPINYDRHPGGRQVSRTGSVYTSFSFVPTFSSIDYRGTLNNNNDYYFNIRNFINGGNSQVTNAALTPFAAIYGDDANDIHAKPIFERDAFNTLGVRELGMINNGCIGCTAGSGGLTGTYFDNQDLTNNGNTRTDISAINFSSDERRYTPFHGSSILPPFGIIVGNGNISARWEGTFQAPISANYTFNMRTDDGTRVLFGGEQVVNDYQGNYPPTDHKFNKYLNAGERRNIRIEWRQGGGGYMAKLLWEFNGVESFIPPCHLFPATADCNFSVSGTASPTNIGCGGSSTLTATCVGSGCTGISYTWQESGSTFINATGSPATVNFGQRSGRFSYNLTASKAGCGNVSGSNSPTINVSGCPPGGGRLLLSNPTGLTNVSNSSNQGSFRVNSTGVNWVISNIPSWATVTPMSGSSGNTDVTVSFQANSNNSRTANLSVIDVTDIADDQTITISQQGSTGGGSCTYTEGQYLFNFYGENVYAHQCGTKYYVTTDGGSGGYFKPKSWLQATGSMTQTQADCFEQDDPRPAGCSGPPPPPPTGGCSFTDGQFLLDWYGETIQAKFCNGILYAPATWGAWKHPNWLIGAGMNPTTAACFATYNPGCGALRISAETPSDQTDENVNIFPNPTTGKIKVVFSLIKDENLWFNLYDTKGKNLQLNDFEGKKGRNEVEFDLQNYTSGAYFIDLQFNQKREVRKVMKVN